MKTESIHVRVRVIASHMLFFFHLTLVRVIGMKDGVRVLLPTAGTLTAHLAFTSLIIYRSGERGKLKETPSHQIA